MSEIYVHTFNYQLVGCKTMGNNFKLTIKLIEFKMKTV